MKILFLSHYFPPEVNAPAIRTHANAREWVRLGHEVHVVTGFPSHPRGRVYDGYRKRWYQRETIDGIQVHRVWTYFAANQGTLRRSLNYVSFLPTAVWRVLRVPRADILIATSPQFMCAVAGFIAAKLRRTPWVFELRDIWPATLSEIGAVKLSLALRIMERLELFMYRSARAVVSVTRSFIADLVSRDIDRDKIVFIPNGVDEDMLRGLEAAAPAETTRRRYAIEPTAFVASYVGSIGVSHSLDTIIEAARRAQEDGLGIEFVLAGDGARRRELQSTVTDEGLRNVHVIGQVPRAEVPDLLIASDALLVLLDDVPIFRKVIPSKLLEGLASGRPIVLGVEGEAKEILETSGAGIAIQPGNAAELLAALQTLQADENLRETMSSIGPDFARREFSRERWARLYLEHLESWSDGASSETGPGEHHVAGHVTTRR